ncbi:hypothetical protein DNTS_033007 [Danionella cerebrum]|uniref:Programmed cell death protein 2 C-terminal domain-containing protein n=1 Tax=Danionella cerebrum TaxID=2873325 RepID=A0A553R5C0_9TELE|nr:hypothetical protein DNTS_033007 [Danionella translucida]
MSFVSTCSEKHVDRCSIIMATSTHQTVLVGVCDGAVDKKKHTSYCTNKIGDTPDPLPVINLQNPSCALCQKALSHVVQIYCPLAASLYHRTINVFACTSQQCNGKPESWFVLRSQCLDDEVKRSESKKGGESTVTKTDWCDDADDWGIEDEEQEKECGEQLSHVCSGEANDISSKLQELCIVGGGDHQRGSQPTDVPAFKPYYISVMDETDLDGFYDMDHENELLREYEEREGVSVEEIQRLESGEAQEEYEKASAKHGDDVFLNFMKKISLCPDQVLRYSWSGTPLFIMELPTNSSLEVPCCRHCGSPRVFEFQLMPALVSLLHSAKTNSDISLEFGTALVYTCRKSCWKSGSVVPSEEFVFVQPDPDQKLFK